MQIDFDRESARVFIVDVLKDPIEEEKKWKHLKFIFAVSKSRREMALRLEVRLMYGDKNDPNDSVIGIIDCKSHDVTVEEMIAEFLSQVPYQGFEFGEPKEVATNTITSVEKEVENSIMYA